MAEQLRVFVSCPKSEKPIDTGVRLTDDQFKDALPKWKREELACPHCGETHRWNGPDAYLAALK
jgi:endogenous inhibitor of DNA gyrase (YacG/DUF329 family)